MKRLALVPFVILGAGCATPMVQPEDPQLVSLTQCIGYAEFEMLSAAPRSAESQRAVANVGNWKALLAQKVPDKKLQEQYHTWGTNSVAPYAPGGQALNTPAARSASLARCEQQFGQPQAGAANGR